jgi:uncharacterized protein
MTLTNPRRRSLLQGCACFSAGLFTSLLAAPAQAAWTNACHPPAALPAACQALVAQALDGLDATKLWDVHAHILGNGDAGSGCTLHPSLTQGFDVVERLRHRAILNATCLSTDEPSVDRAFVQRLLTLVAGFPVGAKWCMFAFEHAHDEQGAAQPAFSTFHVPNAYAATLAKQHPDRFAWVASIHPYREDALTALRTALQQGAVAMKWLPSAMNIDLRSPRLRPMYDALAAARLPLIVHAGEEMAVPGAKRHDLGNPLHLRVPLQHGVRVIAAHAASLGEALDTDSKQPPQHVPAFDLFARMMDERAHEGRLLGDISAVFQTNRAPSVWRQLLQRHDWHTRLLHGSDHPLPGAPALHRSFKWVNAGLLNGAQAQTLDTLRSHNPLLADLVLKRLVRANGQTFPASVFETRQHFTATPQATATSRSSDKRA